MQDALLIIDMGTGNSRVSLTTLDGHIVQIISFENNYYYDLGREKAKYFLPEEWLLRIVEIIKTLCTSHPDYRLLAISATSAREGIVLIGNDGNSMIGLPNSDRRGTITDSMRTVEDEIYSLSGRWLNPLFSALKLNGYREMYPEKYMNIKTFTSISEWLGYELTGNIAITASQACETQLYDVNQLAWSERLCEIFEIDPSMLPEVRSSTDKLGDLKPIYVEEFSLPSTVPFILGGADTQMAIYGVHSKIGDVTIVSGTTSPVVTLVDNNFQDEKKRCWKDAGLLHHWMIETNAGTTGSNFQKYRNVFLSDCKYEEIEQKILSKKAFHCVASFGTMQFFEQRNLLNGGIFTSAPYMEELDRFDIAAAILADEACGIVLHYQSLLEVTSVQPEYILGCGGGFQSRLLGQWISDLTGQRIVLREGFIQSSIQGCVRLCNQYLGKETKDLEIVQIFEPKENLQIQKYYDDWMKYRMLINTQISTFRDI